MRKRINKIYYYILLLLRAIIFVPIFFVFANKFNDFYSFYNLVELNKEFGIQYLIIFISTIIMLALNVLSVVHTIISHKENKLAVSIVLSSLSFLLAGYSIYSLKIINFNYAIVILLFLVNFVFSLILTFLPLFMKTEHDIHGFKSICKSQINEGVGNIDLLKAFYPEIKNDLNIFNYQIISLKYAQHFNYPKVRKSIIDDLEKLCNESLETIKYEQILQTYTISEEYLINTIRKKNKKKFDNIEQRIAKFNIELDEYNRIFTVNYKKFIKKANEYLSLNEFLQKFLTAFNALKDFGNKRLKIIIDDLGVKIENFKNDLKQFLTAFNKIVPNTKIEPSAIASIFGKIDDVVGLKITNANIQDISTSIIFLQDITQKHSQIVTMLESKIKGLTLNDEKSVYDYYEFKHNDTSKIEESFLYLKKNRISYKDKINERANIATIAEIILDDQDALVDALFELVLKEIKVDEYIGHYNQILREFNESKTNNLYIAICYLKENKFIEANKCLDKQSINNFIKYKDINGNNFLHFYPIGKEENAIKNLLSNYPELIPLLYEPNNLGILPYDNINFYNYFNERDNPYPISYESVFSGISIKKKIESASEYIKYKLDQFAMDKKAENTYKEDLKKITDGDSSCVDQICKKYFDDFYKKFDIGTYNRVIKHINSLVIKLDGAIVFEYVKKMLCKLNVDNMRDCNDMLCYLSRTSLSRNTGNFDPLTNKNFYSGQANTFSSAVVLNNIKILIDEDKDEFMIKNQLSNLLTYYLEFTKKLYLITQHRTAYLYITKIDPSFGKSNDENDGLCQVLGIPSGSSVRDIKLAYHRLLLKAKRSGNVEEETRLHAYQERIDMLKG